MAMAASAAVDTPWWTGVPTTLVRKRTLVPGEPTVEALAPGSKLSLPVHTLTFAIPDARDPEDDDDNECRKTDNDNNDEGKPRLLLTGRARRHDRLRMDLGDIAKMVIPGYKPKSYSVSDLRLEQKEFDITIKVYPNGRASGFLDRLKIGDSIHSFGLRKGKVRNYPQNANETANNPFVVGLIAYGVGITEAWPIARAELDRDDATAADRVVLVWASRTPGDTFWNDELEDYRRKHPDRFELVRVYSRERVEGCLHGRIDENVLAGIFGRGAATEATTTKPRTRFLSVGTKAMMKRTDEMLLSIGFSMPEHALLAKSN